MDRLRELLEQLTTADLLRVAVPTAAVALWFAALAAVLAATRVRDVDPVPATQDLGGGESPALVSYLTAGWTITDDAAEATLLDLAARGHLELRQMSDDPRSTTVHVVDGAPADTLTRYERSVLDRVHAVAVDRVVPLTALTFRDPARAASWRAAFAGDVVGQARALGLSRRRVSGASVTALGALALVPAAAVLGSIASVGGDELGAGFGAAFTTFAVLSGIAGRPRGDRDTPLGREVAARWLGLRRYLLVDEAFAALPPASVTVWDRYLAYGDALGVTRVCAAVIDLGLGNRKRVWSSFGGSWHQVRVRYPVARATYGAAAPRLLVGALLGVGFGVLMIRALDLLEYAGQDPRTDPWGSGLLFLALAVLVRGLYRAVRTVVDLVSPVTVEAEVLWVALARSAERNDVQVPVMHHLALDDGTADRTTAWGLPDALVSGCAAGDRVEATLRRWSRRVTAVTVLDHRRVDDAGRLVTSAATPAVPSATPQPVPRQGGAAGAPADLPVVTTAGGIVGAPLGALVTASLAAAAAPAAVPPVVRLVPDALVARLAAVLDVPTERLVPRPVADGGTTGLVVELVEPASGPGGPAAAAVSVVAADGAQGAILVAAHSGRGEVVGGVGDEAWTGPGWGLARRGDVVVRIGLAPRFRGPAAPALPALLTAALAGAQPAQGPAG